MEKIPPEIKKLQKEIEKIGNSLAGKDSKIKQSKKKILLDSYKKLFSKNLIDKNPSICDDLFDAGNTIDDWYPEDKKLAKEYFDNAVKLAKNFDQMLKLSGTFSTSGRYAFAKKLLSKAQKMAKSHEEKWSLAEKFAHANEFDLARKYGNEAISFLTDKSKIKEFKEDLERMTSLF